MTFFFYLIALFSSIFIFLIISLYYLWSITVGVPFVPTDKQMLKEMVDFLVKAKVKNVAELGAGNGRIVFSLASKGIKVTAVEYNPILTIWMRLWKSIKRYNQVTVINGDLFDLKLEEFDAVIVYLFPEYMDKLKQKFKAELKDGSYIICNTFSLKGMEPIRKSGKLYIYQLAK